MEVGGLEVEELDFFKSDHQHLSTATGGVGLPIILHKEIYVGVGIYTLVAFFCD